MHGEYKVKYIIVYKIGLCSVTFENRVRYNVIASGLDAEEGILEVEEILVKFGDGTSFLLHVF
jgi:hypothetical protein